MTDIDKLPPSNFTSYGFKFSLILHGTLVLWLIAHWATESFSNSKSDEEARKLLAKKSIRVDVVDLPSVKFNELHKVDLTKEVEKEPAPKAKEEVVVAPKPNPDVMKLPSDKKTTKEDPKKDEAKKRLEEIQKSLRAEAKRQEIMNKYKQADKPSADVDTRKALGGNILSKGSSVQGDVADGDEEMKAAVQSHVRKFWRAPPWAAGQNYHAQVVIKISPSGKVLSKSIFKSSGRPEFDASVIEAVEAADPFPAPPEKFKRVLMNEGMLCGFPE